jgi:hypothetical protein
MNAPFQKNFSQPTFLYILKFFFWKTFKTKNFFQTPFSQKKLLAIPVWQPFGNSSHWLISPITLPTTLPTAIVASPESTATAGFERKTSTNQGEYDFRQVRVLIRSRLIAIRALTVITSPEGSDPNAHNDSSMIAILIERSFSKKF